MTAFDLAADSRRFNRLLDAWMSLQGSAEKTRVPDGELLRSMLAAEEELRRQGHWVSGPTTLLEVLRLESDEVRNCRVLRWILDPLAPHGLGADVLGRLLGSVTKAARRQKISVPTFDRPHEATVTVEEQRGGTRADVVINGPEWSVVIEAKINAGEQVDQGLRLSEHWAGATFVYLTRDGSNMATAGDVPWVRLSWQEVRSATEASLAQVDAASPPPSVERARRAVEDYVHATRGLPKPQRGGFPHG